MCERVRARIGAMITLNYGEFFASRRFVKLSVLTIIAFACFYLGNHWYDSYPNLVFFSKQTSLASSPSISISPNANKTLDTYSIVSNLTTSSDSQSAPPPIQSPAPPPLIPSPAPQRLHLPAVPERYGIVDESGMMCDEFDVGDLGDENETATMEKEGPIESSGIIIRRFRVCDESLKDYVPCMDNVEEIRRLKSTERGENLERHCPGEGQGLDCLVQAPKGYKTPVPWPRSRNEVWFSNLPNSRLVKDKWISRKQNKIKFSGADQYLNQISQMIPDISFGHHTRVALDVGCGLASFGAFLFSRNVITLSIAPKEENQIQFALERGVPAMVAAFATHRLLYPSQAFELIHCSSCQVNWLRDDGILLLEVNRMLKAGGYFVWATQPHEGNMQKAWKGMEDLTVRICWELVKNEKNIAIWRKPLNNNCYFSRDDGVQPPLCDRDDDPDNVWNVDLKACISRLPENGYGSNLTTWPERLTYFPHRLQTVDMDAYTSKRELFKAESGYWNDIIGGYVRAFHWKKMKLRNVLDMRAGFGGFAAALIDKQIDCWVLNVVPTTEPNTLPAIYDRGLIGVVHDWCEPFDTYPRTYDLLHAAGLFSVEQKRCNVSTIVLEMDRILRPGGRVYIRDSIAILNVVKEVAAAIGWRTQLRDTSEGAYASRKLLMCEK